MPQARSIQARHRHRDAQGHFLPEHAKSSSGYEEDDEDHSMGDIETASGRRSQRGSYAAPDVHNPAHSRKRSGRQRYVDMDVDEDEHVGGGRRKSGRRVAQSLPRDAQGHFLPRGSRGAAGTQHVGMEDDDDVGDFGKDASGDQNYGGYDDDDDTDYYDDDYELSSGWEDRGRDERGGRRAVHPSGRAAWRKVQQNLPRRWHGELSEKHLPRSWQGQFAVSRKNRPRGSMGQFLTPSRNWQESIDRNRRSSIARRNRSRAMRADEWWD